MEDSAIPLQLVDGKLARLQESSKMLKEEVEEEEIAEVVSRWTGIPVQAVAEEEVDKLLEVLRVKNQQACRQLKYIINRGCETDLYTAQGFEMLSGGLSGAVNGFWEVADADHGRGIMNFKEKGELWKNRRALAKNFWSE